MPYLSLQCKSWCLLSYLPPYYEHPLPLLFLILVYSILVHSCIFEYFVTLILLLSTITILSFVSSYFLLLLNSILLSFCTSLLPTLFPVPFFVLSSLASSLKASSAFISTLNFFIIYSSLFSSSRFSSRQQPPSIHSFLNSLPFPISRSFFYFSLKLSSTLLFSSILFFSILLFSSLIPLFSYLLTALIFIVFSSPLSFFDSSSFLLRSYLNFFLSWSNISSLLVLSLTPSSSIMSLHYVSVFSSLFHLYSLCWLLFSYHLHTYLSLSVPHLSSMSLFSFTLLFPEFFFSILYSHLTSLDCNRLKSFSTLYPSLLWFLSSLIIL